MPCLDTCMFEEVAVRSEGTMPGKVQIWVFIGT